MGTACATPEHEEALEEGKRVVVLVHGLASCALEAVTARGRNFFLCDHLDTEEEHKRLVYVSIGELVKRPHIVKSLALTLEDSHNKEVPCVDSKCGYEGMDVRPVEGLSGIRTLNPGEDVTPVQLWHNLIEHLSPDYNCLAFNYDWRRWGDLNYVDELRRRFKKTIEQAVKIAGGKPVVMVGHSLGAQVTNYMLGYLGQRWTEENVSDLVLVGPANMGSPCSLAAYANGPSTVAHSSVIPLADMLEIRLRDVASTWPGLISVLPNRLGGDDVFDFKPFAMRKGIRKYFAGDCVPFLEDLATCEDEDQTLLYHEEAGIHEKVRNLLHEYNLLDTTRGWEAGFPKAAKIRRAFEQKITPHLKPPLGCRVHVVYSMGVPTLSNMIFEENLRKKADQAAWDSGDDTILASSVEKMCEVWRHAGVSVHKYHAHKIHHKELITCPYMMKVMSEVMEHGGGEESSEYEAEEDLDEHACSC